ncbi:hypothetical protein BC938DRAFT_473496 [Jimgerdemannia flammicorona]|uniref:Uncharacterized protein n=1 Tax=Jimgerdemannia flammicorona TaxID=994334 RepID=A0A433Q423_9FUNG|nr:hypothetical protein BC938DRAFT_473496 [Jimgerdemannia flammicorona]
MKLHDPHDKFVAMHDNKNVTQTDINAESYSHSQASQFRSNYNVPVQDPVSTNGAACQQISELQSGLVSAQTLLISEQAERICLLEELAAKVLEVDTLKATLEAERKGIRKLEMELASKNAELDRIYGNENEIQRLQRIIATEAMKTVDREKALIHKELLHGQAIVELEARVKMLEESIASKDTEIVRLNDVIGEIEERQGEVADADPKFEQLMEELRRKEDEVAKGDSAIVELQESMESLCGQLEDKDAELNNLDRRLKNKNAELDDTSKLAADRLVEIQQLQASLRYKTFMEQQTAINIFNLTERAVHFEQLLAKTEAEISHLLSVTVEMDKLRIIVEQLQDQEPNRRERNDEQAGRGYNTDAEHNDLLNTPVRIKRKEPTSRTGPFQKGSSSTDQQGHRQPSR